MSYRGNATKNKVFDCWCSCKNTESISVLMWIKIINSIRNVIFPAFKCYALHTYSHYSTSFRRGMTSTVVN